MNRALAAADSAHYDPRLAKLSTRPASHACGSRPCTRSRRPTASGYLLEAAVSSGHPARDSGVLQHR